MLDINKSVAKFFDDGCDKCGDSGWRAAYWLSEEYQYGTYLVLSSILDSSSNSVLDLGCGQGDYYCFLKRHLYQQYAYYEGIDISGKMIHYARQRFPEATFLQKDFLDEDFNNEYDHIVGAGTFNYRVDNQEDYIKLCISKMYRLAKKIY